MGNGKQVAYIRVSTVDQHTERQLQDILGSMDRIFTDHCSGKDANRPQLQACRDFLREDDVLHVHSIDRLARNLTDLKQIVEELNAEGVTVVFHKEGLTFKASAANDPMNTLLLSIMAAFAEFERSLILERQREGIAEARKRNAYANVGRKKNLSQEKIAELKARLEKGEKATHLAKEYGISRTCLYRYLKG